MLVDWRRGAGKKACYPLLAFSRRRNGRLEKRMNRKVNERMDGGESVVTEWYFRRKRLYLYLVWERQAHKRIRRWRGRKR